MTQLDMSKVSYCSLFPGLGNPDTISISIPIPSQAIGVAPPYEQTNTINFDGSTRLATILMNLPGLDSTWRVNGGAIDQEYNASNQPVFIGDATGVYQVVVAYHFSLPNIIIYTRVAALSGSRTVPAFTVNLAISKFVPPF